MITRTRVDLERFDYLVNDLRYHLLQSTSVEVGEWQAQKSNIPTMELQHVSLQLEILDAQPVKLAKLLGANLPWAEDHFQERVSGQPLNPAPSEAWWPYAQQGNAEHKKGQIFSHTYPERMWPKMAGTAEHFGIRFAYGDLRDVVNQLKANPSTRQAYLPIWFPEDTGAVHRERVPCSLGYHFLYRNNALDIVYYIRSCDFVRHFRDDIYMAMRLCQWVLDQAGLARCGSLVMHISSLHAFEPDRYDMEQKYGKWKQSYNERLMSSL